MSTSTARASAWRRLNDRLEANADEIEGLTGGGAASHDSLIDIKKIL